MFLKTQNVVLLQISSVILFRKKSENLVRKILKIIRDNISASNYDDLPCYGHSLQTMAVGECDSGSRSGIWA